MAEKRSSSILEKAETGCWVLARGAVITTGSLLYQGPWDSLTLFHSGPSRTLLPILLHVTGLEDTAADCWNITGARAVNWRLDILSPTTELLGSTYNMLILKVKTVNTLNACLPITKQNLNHINTLETFAVLLQPRKFITIRCRMTWAKIKSAKALSGLIPANWDLLAGFTWDDNNNIIILCLQFIVLIYTWSRRQTARTNEATLEMNPERKALKGNVPTKQQ